MYQLTTFIIEITIGLLKFLVTEREKKILSIFNKLSESEKSQYLSDFRSKYFVVFFDSDKETRNQQENKCILSEISAKHNLRLDFFLKTINYLESLKNNSCFEILPEKIVYIYKNP